MFGLGSNNRPSAPWSPEETTVKTVVLLAIKQIVFLICIGLIIWAAHSLAHSPANAHTSPPSVKVEESENTGPKSPALPASDPVIKGHNLNMRSKP